MVQASSGRYNNSTATTYDDAGRKATESLTAGGQTYTTTVGYDAASRQSTITYPDGTVLNRSYTDRNQLHQLTYGGTVVDTRTYDAGRRMLSSAYNNGVSETRAYNNDNTLSSISFSGLGFQPDIGDMTYTWDDNKNKTSETITGTLAAYSFTTGANGYDDEDRLTNYTRGTLTQSWNLSNEGDWNVFTENGVAQNRTHGPAHELASIATTPVTHDVNGNITSKPSSLNPTDTSTLSWDFDNRLTSVDTDSDSTIDASYTYDALGRRVTSGTTVFVCLGQQVMAEYTTSSPATSPTEQYVYASYIDEPVLKDSATHGLAYYHRNQQYSIIALTSSTGTILEQYAYSAYGQLAVLDPTGTVASTSSVNNSYTYTGRRFEPTTGDYYYRARYYDAKLGRFLGRDPIGYEGSMWNLYTYVGNCATSYLDASGTVRYQKHHWFMKFWRNPGLGQAKVDALCRCPKVPINKFTTKYTVQEHRWIHSMHGGETFITYQIQYESLLSRSKTCCDLLRSMLAMMLAWDALVQTAHAEGAIEGDADPNHVFHLVSYYGDGATSTLPDYIATMKMYCGSGKNQTDKTKEIVQLEMTTIIDQIESFDGFNLTTTEKIKRFIGEAIKMTGPAPIPLKCCPMPLLRPAA